jgi:hypothetical protein
VCGDTTEDRVSTYCCGPRVYSIAKETLKSYAPFFTWEPEKRKFRVYSNAVEDLGTYPMEIQV